MPRAYPTLKHWRKAQGLNQEQAAKRLGVSQTFYSRIERKKQAPRPPKAATMSAESGVPLEEILGVAVVGIAS